jgi:hypothetical protein
MDKVNCQDCKFLNVYVTGADEYPPHTGISYCAKDHWDCGDPDDNTGIECKDFEKKPESEDSNG